MESPSSLKLLALMVRPSEAFHYQGVATHGCLESQPRLHTKRLHTCSDTAQIVFFRWALAGPALPSPHFYGQALASPASNGFGSIWSLSLGIPLRYIPDLRCLTLFENAAPATKRQIYQMS